MKHCMMNRMCRKYWIFEKLNPLDVKNADKGPFYIFTHRWEAELKINFEETG
jgi:hypothetical protein